MQDTKEAVNVLKLTARLILDLKTFLFIGKLRMTMIMINETCHIFSNSVTEANLKSSVRCVKSRTTKCGS